MYIFYSFIFGVLVHLVFHITTADPLHNMTPATSSPFLHLNLNIKLNPKTTMHGDVYNLKYGHPDTLHELVLFEQIRKTMLGHAMFKVMCFVEFLPYLRTFESLDNI